jgi:hypothetical protein
MAGYRPDQLADLVNFTLRKYFRNEWTDFSLIYQQYYGISNLLMDPRQDEDGGVQLEFKAQFKNSGAATNTGLYAKQEVDVQDVSIAGYEPWSFQQTHFAYDEREDAFQSTAERLVREIEVRRHDALNSLAELMEENLWSFPANNSDQGEKLKPKGITYWIVPNATAGFNGNHQSGWTTVGNIDPDTYTGWKNYTNTYTNISRTDFARKVKLALWSTQWKNPNPFPDAGKEHGKHRKFMATTYNVCQIAEELLEQQNDNLGGELDKYYGMVRFRSNPLVAIPYLQENHGSATDFKKNPVIGVDLDVFKAKWKTGMYMTWGKPKDAPYQDLVKHVHCNNAMQYICRNRRKNFYLYQL